MIHLIIAIQQKMKKLNEKTAAKKKQSEQKARDASTTSPTSKPTPDKNSQADR